jgi:hypothetical protein
MIKIELVNPLSDPEIPMSQMKPFQIGQIMSNSARIGNIVMRTQNERFFEVMDLSDSRPDSQFDKCYGDVLDKIKVRLFRQPVKITIVNNL